MTPNNNLSILPFYKITTANPTPRDDQKWWKYGRVFPLFTPGIPPFIIEGSISNYTFALEPVSPNTQGGTEYFNMANAYVKQVGGTDYIINPETAFAANAPQLGRYRLLKQIGSDVYTSDVFTIVKDLTPYLKLEWWDDADFIMDAGAIPYGDEITVTPLSFGTNVKSGKYINQYGGLSSSTSWNVFYFPCSKGDRFSFTYTGSVPSTSARIYAIYSTDNPDDFSTSTRLEVGNTITLGTTEIEITDDNAKMIAVTVSTGASLTTTGNKTRTTLGYRNVLYLPTDIAKPDYSFTEDGEERDGYYFAIKQISQKRYRFKFLAPEYLLDVMRLIRLSDHIKITYRGQEYYPDTFLMTPTWESEGDLASVECEFTTDTVAKKIGRLITP